MGPNISVQKATRNASFCNSRLRPCLDTRVLSRESWSSLDELPKGTGRSVRQTESREVGVLYLGFVKTSTLILKCRLDQVIS